MTTRAFKILLCNRPPRCSQRVLFPFAFFYFGGLGHFWIKYLSAGVMLYLSRVQKHLRVLVGDDLFSTLQLLSHRLIVISFSLVYRYHYGRVTILSSTNSDIDSQELTSPPPPVHGGKSSLSQSCSFHKEQAPIKELLPQDTLVLCNRLSVRCFPKNYNNIHLSLSPGATDIYPIRHHIMHF